MLEKRCHRAAVCLLVVTGLAVSAAQAQQSGPVNPSTASQEGTFSPSEELLLKRIEKLEQTVAALQAQNNQLAAALQSTTAPRPAGSNQESAAPSSSASAVPAANPGPSQVSNANSSSAPDFLAGTTINGYLDLYYAYNFNDPIGRVNLLRAYDVSSNAFSLNQAAVVIENAPDIEKGKRWGARLDLQFGQATATLQGNPNNEPRPDVYRAIFQAYGTYVFPIGSGLTVDFGKWASSLGIEGNYSKDDLNYSRSFWFDFLPFYHMGARVNYKVNNVLGLNYWVTNGTQQTEPFNGFKDELFGLTLQPHKTVNWTVNYYLGQEHPDVIFNPPNAPVGLPSLQGTPFEPISGAPNGKLHIFDSYVTWQPSNKWTLALEGDYVIQRLNANSAPAHTDGGAAYVRYQWTPRFALATRAEYLSDRGGLFTGISQALKENTITAQYRLANGFLLDGEWRRDFSNSPYFLTNQLGVLKKEQNTATLGLMWWFGQKQGAW